MWYSSVRKEEVDGEVERVCVCMYVNVCESECECDRVVMIDDEMMIVMA